MRAGQTVHIRGGGTGGLPDWVTYDPEWSADGLIEGGLHEVEYLAQENPDGSYTVDVHGYLGIGDSTTLPLPTSQMWLWIVPDAISTIFSDIYEVRACVGSIQIFDDSMAAYHTGTIYGYGFNGMGSFFNADGTPVTSTSPMTWAVLDWLMFSIRYHVVPSG
jgi:hypothetical protein